MSRNFKYSHCGVHCFRPPHAQAARPILIDQTVRLRRAVHAVGSNWHLSCWRGLAVRGIFRFTM